MHWTQTANSKLIIKKLIIFFVQCLQTLLFMTVITFMFFLFSFKNRMYKAKKYQSTTIWETDAYGKL